MHELLVVGRRDDLMDGPLSVLFVYVNMGQSNRIKTQPRGLQVVHLDIDIQLC